jgi:hypothetical protein
MYSALQTGAPEPLAPARRRTDYGGWVVVAAALFYGSAAASIAPGKATRIADTAVTTLALSVTEFESIVDEEPGYFRAFAGLLLERYADLFRYPGEAHGLPTEDGCGRGWWTWPP